MSGQKLSSQLPGAVTRVKGVINIVDPVEVGINTAARTHARLRERERKRERERGRASLVVHRIAAAAASRGRGMRQYSSTQAYARTHACTHARTNCGVPADVAFESETKVPGGQ